MTDPAWVRGKGLVQVGRGKRWGKGEGSVENILEMGEGN
jgi:hypothetical protein